MKDLTDSPDLTLGDEALRLSWPDGTSGTYPYIWLRDNCPSGFHPQTEERTLDLMSLPDTPHPAGAKCSGDVLDIDWAEDAHRSQFTLAWLKANRPGHPKDDPAGYDPILWTSELGETGVPHYEATALMTDDATLRAWIDDTARYGLSIVTGVPQESGAGAEIAKRIHFLRRTNFGVTFEVMNKPDPNNIAYTAEALTLHTDLPNQEMAPGYQFLHCIANEAAGGGSVFADGYALADALRVSDPDAFDLLSTVAIPFRFHDRDDDLRSRRPVIALNHAGEVTELSWSVHLTDTFDMPPDQMAPYYRAYRAFMALTRDPAFQVTLRLNGGDMAVFDNRRVLHGREAFDPSTGFRHLQGYYVDRGEFNSKRRVMARA
ncbi:MAG: TauD/TfdA family dioxygenase [Pseudomonadota bacterium]